MKKLPKKTNSEPLDPKTLELILEIKQAHITLARFFISNTHSEPLRYRTLFQLGKYLREEGVSQERLDLVIECARPLAEEEGIPMQNARKAIKLGYCFGQGETDFWLKPKKHDDHHTPPLTEK